MALGLGRDVLVIAVDRQNASVADQVANVSESQGAAAVKIADFDDKIRFRFPEDFLIDPEIQRVLHCRNAMVGRTLHDPLLHDREHSRQWPIERLFHKGHYFPLASRMMRS